MKLLCVEACILAIALSSSSFTAARQQEEKPSTGTIKGTVTDASGLPIGGAAVDISSVDGETSLATDLSGRYATRLQAGVYDLGFSVAGYKSVQERNVVVNAGSESQVDAKLEPEEQ